MLNQRFARVCGHFVLVAFSFVLALPVGAATSSDGFWSDASAARIAQLGQRATAPAKPRTLNLDINGLKTSLANAPVIHKAPKGVSVTLPMPDGSFERFEAFASQIMEKGLQDQMPDARNYVIQGVKDRTASGRINVTSAGLFAIVLRAGETVYVETWGRNTIDTYVSYYSRDFFRETTAKPFECGVTGSSEPAPLHRPIGAINRGLTAGMYGSQLKTFRMAIAATTEFTADQGGAANALTSITNTVTALNAIYERELAVRFMLVANNATIVYSGADPYSNGSLGLMIDENQINLDNVIGTANYDIGHVFGFLGGGGGSGLASTASVCNATRKGTGGSIGSAGAGQPFLVNLVAHEIGHQHDANHTFNGTTGSCAGSRSASTAWEPASGSTLMSYGGICGAEDIVNNQDAYFHTGSLGEMNNWIRVNPTGSSCGTLTATGNAPPASMGLGQTYTIPINTPFELAGMSNDANGDQVTHSWEQFDVGAPSPPNTDDGTRAIFRSFPAVVSPTRNLPKTFDILSNSTSFGESLPTTNRTMNFRMTARDNRAGGGGVGWTTSQVTSSTASGPFAITSFNNGGGVASGAAATVTWNVANTNLAPVNCAQVDILLSSDGGATFPTTLAANAPNDGSQSVVMPGNTTQARIKVKCSNNIFFDINDADFGIGASLTSFCDTPGLALPTFGNVTDTLNIAPTGTIIDVNVSVAASIGVFADAGSFTVSHLGTDVRLLDGLASCNGDNIGAVFDDEAAAAPGSVCSGNPAINGAIQPVGTLANYDAAEQSGVWSLNWNGVFSCGGGGCSGTLDEWCVITAVALGPPGNNPPDLTPIPDQTVPELGNLSVPLMATDPDLNTLAFSTTNLPAFCGLTDNGNGTGSIDCNPGAGTANTYTVTVTVTDNGTGNLTDQDAFDIVVQPVGGNNPPVLAPIGPQMVTVGNMLTIPLAATDQDGNTITLTEVNTPAFCNFTDNGGGSGNIVCNPAMGNEGPYMITVTATDNGAPPLQDFETFTLTVNADNGTITQCVTPNLAIPFDGANPTVSDIVLAQTDLIDDINVSLNIPHAWIGDLDVQLTHVDTGQSVLILDEPGNPDLGANGCDQADIDVILDDEAALPAEGECETTPPAMGGTLKPNNLLSAFDNEAATGTWRLTVTDVFTGADDGTLQEWCVIITPAAAVNNPPVLNPIGNQMVAEGASLNVGLTATDQDGNALTFSETGLPGFCMLTPTGPGAATIACNPTVGDANTYPVTVTITDNGVPAMMDQESFNIVVTPQSNEIVMCNSPGTAVSDAQIVTDDMVIADTSTIADLNVSLNLSHTYVGDLNVSLTNVGSGTTVRLLDQPGDPAQGSFGCDNPDVIAEFDDESGTPAEDQCNFPSPAIGGSVSPTDPLSGFDGSSAAATWRLTVEDTEGGDDGTLTQWCVIITPGVGGTDTDSDGILDSVDNCTTIANPTQVDSNGDGFGNRCDADLNNDCIVNALDLGIFKNVFFTTDADADFSGDGVVNAIDLGILRQLFFMPPGPNSTGTCP